ncbi:LuxR C-terminal-related transcriptional regulator [Acinetobacter silvestris]|uniref:DNA-binding response regulator n=1 Tax=Acinetobacter silvestris TaxID=1977882 RepID=A0A1Y3CHP4_9GAMM|nr:response regulator transcription factor [Acinetobacter silvestris]OTG65625.1 DNA-binding response regulator [Acinetobacter silvestris]
MVNELILPVPVVIIEDEPLIQIRLQNILVELGYPLDQIILASGVQEAKLKCNQYLPNFALVDLGLPDGNGIELIEQFKHNDLDISILVISAWSTQDAILGALKAGATGYVLKERDDLEISLAIRSVVRGGAPIDPFIARQILEQMETATQTEAQTIENKIESDLLSIREHEILELVAKGMSNREIANFLNLSRYTVECHIKYIYRKLSVSSRIKAINTARSMGILH